MNTWLAPSQILPYRFTNKVWGDIQKKQHSHSEFFSFRILFFSTR